jgi:L-ascorbate metabolism protein UlaG (beta-lactamase superfamily)
MILSLYLLISLCLSSLAAPAQTSIPTPLQASLQTPRLKFIWTGIAGVAVTDGQTTLLFDLVFTKPTLLNWVFNTKFKSDPEKVELGLQKADVQFADAVFSSHEHFDHVIDLPEIARRTKATVYGGPSLERIIKKSGLDVKFSLHQNKELIQIGDFKIIGFKRQHPPILQKINWSFLPGAVSQDFDFNFYDYKEGDVWSYRVEHPLGRILFDQSSHYLEENSIYNNKTDVYFLGVSNKVSLFELVENNIKRINAPMLVVTHFDFFFLQSDFLEKIILPGAELGKIKKAIDQSNLSGTTKIQFIVPELFKEMYYPLIEN